MRASSMPLAWRLSSAKSNASRTQLKGNTKQLPMAAPTLKLETDAPGGMDRSIQRGRWSPARWPIALKVAVALAGAVLLILLIARLFSGSGERTVRLPAAQVTVT